MTETPDPNAMPPGPMGYTAPARPTRSRGTGLIILGVLALAVVGITACDSLPGAVDALQVGDCIDEPEEGATVTEIQHQPCNTPHDGEVVANLTNPAGPDDPYPVLSGFEDYVVPACIPAFESYTGRDWETDTDLNLAWLSPTLTGWADGDRGFTCYVVRLDDGKLNGTVRGIGASPLPVPTP